MKFKPYSFSKMSCYNECPQMFKLKYIDKIKISPIDPRFFEKGNFYHSFLEHYPALKPFNFKFASDEEQEQFQNTIQEFIDIPRVNKLLNNKFGTEIEFKFDENLNNFTSGSKWKSALYGYIDYIGVEDETIHIIDWKSKDHGERFPTNKAQLELYAVWLFTVRPKVKKIICEFAYIENKTFQEYVITRDYSDVIKKEIINNINVIETDDVFECNKSKECSKCDYFNICKPFNVKTKRK